MLTPNATGAALELTLAARRAGALEAAAGVPSARRRLQQRRCVPTAVAAEEVGRRGRAALDELEVQQQAVPVHVAFIPRPGRQRSPLPSGFVAGALGGRGLGPPNC